MVYSLYFRFLKITHCSWISSILARLVYCVYLSKFLVQRGLRGKKIITGDANKAKALVATIHPDPQRKPVIEHPSFDPAIDLSIIVPVYNYANLIRKNIESILGQNTKYRYEVIIVDDGSTDGARDIVRGYATDTRVKVICQDNQGIAGARNTGLNHARGRYVMFVDCDDVVKDDIVETLMSKAYEQKSDIVMCAHELVKERDGAIISVIPNVYSAGNLSGYSEAAAILNYAGLPWCKVYKRELWQKVRFLPGYWYEDTIIQSLLFTQCNKFDYVPRNCYCYRWYENNFSHTQGKRNNPKCIDRYWMLVPILEKACELGVTESDCFYTMLLKHLSAYYYPTIQGMDEEIIEALFVLACDLFRQYRPSKRVKLPYMLRVTEKALDIGDINLWKLASKYQ